MGFRISKVFKWAVPAVANFFGGPIAAVAASAVHGAASSNSHNRAKGAAEGVGRAIAVSSLASTVGDLVGASPGSGLGEALGMNHPSLLNQMGVSGAPSTGGGFGASSLLQGLGGGNILGNLAQFVPDILSRTQRQQNPQHDEPYQEMYPGDEGNLSSLSRYAPSEGYNMAEQGDIGHFAPAQNVESDLSSALPELSKKNTLYNLRTKQLFEDQEINKKKKKEKEKRQSYAARISKFAKGGPVKSKNVIGNFYIGHIKEGNTGGQDDDIEGFIPPKSYVMNATDVSLMGDGSTDNGIKKFTDYQKHLLKGCGMVRNHGLHAKGVRARVSNDEFIFVPAAVKKLGKGSIARGTKKFDTMRDNLRKHKGVKDILPPKAKKINDYMS